MSKRISTSFNEPQILLMHEILTKMLIGSDTKLLVKNKHFGSLVGAVQSLKRRAENPTPPKSVPPSAPAPEQTSSDELHSTHVAEAASAVDSITAET